MKVYLFLVCIMTLSLFSCKNDEKKPLKEESISVEKSAINPEIFTITLKAVVKKDDSFQVYFKDLESDPFEEKNSIYSEFVGSEEAQDIVFELPEAVIPNFIRMDFGVNKEQPEIIIKSLKLSYQGKDLDITEKQYFDYFIPNELTVKFDKATSKVVPFVTKEGL